MNKLNALKNYLIQLRLVTSEKIEAYPENGRMDIISKPGKQGLEITQVYYDGIIELTEVKASFHHIAAIISAWLVEQDHDRFTRFELDNPEFDYDLKSDHTTDIQLTIPFCESVYLVENTDGPIAYDNQRYDTGDYDLWVAETGEVTDASTR
ncbi:phage tail protein [Spartinivicinus ruber]|uniref:phage tail protein n=1 Tax=Spartinivicinus ruber TaxID=2683272 RepID=UPI0013D040BB|nr:phage tail protein [Spartinivicinus ruber]